MYKKCLKTYGYMLRYVFFMLGILFLAILMGGAVAVKNSKAAVTTMAENISTITKNSDLSFDGVRDAIMQELGVLTPDEHVEEIRENGLSEATGNFFEEALSKTLDNYTEYAGEVSEEITGAVMKILLNLMIVVVAQVIALIIGENVVAILAGRDLLKKSAVGIMGTIANRVCRWIYKLVVFGLIALMLSIVPVVGILLIVCYPLLSCFLAILSRYYIAMKGKRSFSEVVNAKNVFTLFAADVTCIAFAVVIALIVMMIIGGLAAFYILISLLAITNVAVRLNAYRFAEETEAVPAEVA